MVNPGADRDTTQSESLSPTQCSSSFNTPLQSTLSDNASAWVTAPTLLGSDPSLPSLKPRVDADMVPRTLVSGVDHDGITPEGVHPMLDATGTDGQHDTTTLQPFPSFDNQTDLRNLLSSSPMEGSGSENHLRQSVSTNSLPRRTASIRAALAATLPSAGSVSPGSVISSPQLAAMGDITPLPSPIQRGVSSWRIGRTPSQSLSRASSTTSRSGSSFNLRSSDYSYPHRQAPSRSTPSQAPESTPERDTQQTHLKAPSDRKHARNRSLSEYVPDALPVSQKRQNSVSGSERPKSSASSHGANIHREQYLAVQRGIAIPASRPPTPPRSIRSGYDSGDTPNDIISPPTADRSQTFLVNSIRSKQPRQYRMLRQLGQGTFSQVVLAVRQEMDQHLDSSHPAVDGFSHATQKLVAVKIVEYGPAGGADQERVEVSLKREVDILRSVNHPSLVQLKAFGSDEKRALLVLDFCPGGDLFEFASHGTKPLGAGLIRRIFSELISAVRYLHQNLIVHRDIKLENVLVNIPNLATIEKSDWTSYDRAVVTLTDLGLSRRVPPPPESATLHTRCGSVDYAAPEILMGQGYDGRATDAWALGVLLYAIMEQRLPFDPLPGSRGDPEKLRQRTPHRIARCEWSWYRLADDQGEFDATKGRGLEDAHDCVEELLRRSTRRKTLDEIAAEQWVHDAIVVPSGLQRGDKEVP
ncbi:hypothetical protein FQN54_005109 [Arachnomyces sp. PD_36]|nr:hypothetical protein FQN54_005109 [Arachnomyces sp. PD_36]